MPIEFKIGRYSIGQGHPCFIIAEAGVNHNGSMELAKKMIDEAKSAGADAIKFQTFISENLVSEDAQKAEYQSKNDPRHKTQLEMLKSLELSQNQFKELKDYCDSVGILFLSTPFDLQSVDILERIGVVAYKIPSGEITNLQLIEYVSRKGKPIILSTGMANLKEIKRAIEVIHSTGNNQVAVLQCTTSYPAPAETLNLRAIQTLAKKFKIPVGLSDHSEGVIASVAAVAIGACILEKHFSLDKLMQGPDHKASLEPKELKEMIYSIRTTEKMLGSGIKKAQEIELSILKHARKSIFASTNIQAGERISKENISLKRPLVGIPAEDADKAIGKMAKINISARKPIKWKDLGD